VTCPSIAITPLVLIQISTHWSSTEYHALITPSKPRGVRRLDFRAPLNSLIFPFAELPVLVQPVVPSLQFPSLRQFFVRGLKRLHRIAKYWTIGRRATHYSFACGSPGL